MNPVDELRQILQSGMRYAMSLTHDEARADDLLQDAWYPCFAPADQ